MRYGSVCSGIEAATAAWECLDWDASFFAEVEPFCNAVLDHHYPEVPNLGDFTKIEEGRGPVDVLVGGTPCQTFSSAGPRTGLRDPRGNLALEFCLLATRLEARWLVWENVAGLLSSEGGRDFGTILGALAECGYGFAYRVLDAQYFGVPQRRRRIFIVGYLGDWRPPAAVLFEPESLRGDPPTSREARENAAQCLTRSAGVRGAGGEPYNTTFVPHRSRAVTARGDRQDASVDNFVTYNVQPLSASIEPNTLVAKETDTAERLSAVGAARRSDRGDLVLAFDMVQATHPENRARFAPGEPSGTLAKTSRPHVAAHSKIRRLTPREWERLMGFEDDYTLVPYRGKPAKDGPRYSAIGNSMAVPVMRWIGGRIAMVESLL